MAGVSLESSDVFNLEITVLIYQAILIEVSNHIPEPSELVALLALAILHLDMLNSDIEQVFVVKRQVKHTAQSSVGSENHAPVLHDTFNDFFSLQIAFNIAHCVVEV